MSASCSFIFRLLFFWTSILSQDRAEFFIPHYYFEIRVRLLTEPFAGFVVWLCACSIAPLCFVPLTTLQWKFCSPTCLRSVCSVFWVVILTEWNYPYFIWHKFVMWQNVLYLCYIILCWLLFYQKWYRDGPGKNTDKNYRLSQKSNPLKTSAYNSACVSTPQMQIYPVVCHSYPHRRTSFGPLNCSNFCNNFNISLQLSAVFTNFF